MVWRANVNNCRANEDNSAKNIIFGQPKIVCAQIRRIKFYVCAQHKIVCAQKRRTKFIIRRVCAQYKKFAGRNGVSKNILGKHGVFRNLHTISTF